jgi:hypothetical protein
MAGCCYSGSAASFLTVDIVSLTVDIVSLTVDIVRKRRNTCNNCLAVCQADKLHQARAVSPCCDR